MNTPPSSPQIHAVKERRSDRRGAGWSRTALGRADVVLLGFGLGDGAHPELAVFVGAPRERDAGVGDDHGVTLAAGTGDDAVVGKGLDDGGGGAVVEVAVAELARLVAAPGEHAAVLGDGHQCAAADPPHTAEMGTPARVEMREGSMTFGVANRPARRGTREGDGRVSEASTRRC